MSKITIYDEFTSFITDLVELLKEDWRKFKLFIKKNKNYCLWILILFITLQFTDLLNLGASWNRYCKKHEYKQIQIGGDGDAPAPLSDKDQAKAVKAQAKESLKAVKAQAKADKKTEKSQSKAEKAEKTDAKKADKAQAKDAKKEGKAAAGPAPSLGPSIEKIMNMTSGMFVIISFILVVIGVLSLPIIVLIVITYTILKFLVSKISNL